MMNNNPFKQLGDWRKNFDQFFGDEFWNGFEPMIQNMQTQTNLYRNENEIVCIMALPGLEKPDEVEVFIHPQHIEVKGHIRLPIENLELVEEGIFQGDFERKIELPFPVREDKVEATYENGLLFIHLHRHIPNNTKRKIMIQNGVQTNKTMNTSNE
ncbi:heat-shock protein Hsp20 [Sutcliffiella cohnii]|uniref:Heat-shock protein Hsp20 n=3 Tax=Bacillaceae TaxID=186817 RepID=A0A223KXV2_9BACI|nr:heat-shock protein Hsp20 [Sutcliffiella cohnii]